MFVRNNDTNVLFNTIADAFTAANPGETIEVLSGYTGPSETVSTGLSNLTLILPANINFATQPTIDAANPIVLNVMGGNSTGQSVTFLGSLGTDLYLGSDGVDSMSGGSGGDDQLFGRGGNDVFLGALDGAGNDLFDGGAGIDLVQYSGTNANVSVDLQAGTATSAATGTDTLVSVEDIVTAGGNDALRGDASANYLSASAGNDVLEGRGGDDYLSGGADIDDLNGGLGNDHIDGGAGPDFVRHDVAGAAVTVDLSVGSSAGQGNDFLIHIENASGTDGNDILIGRFDENILQGLGGNDRLEGRAGNDAIDGGAGNDIILGEDGNDNLYGVDGDDDINGGAGNDGIFGGVGSDTANYSATTGGIVATITNGDGTVTGDGTDTLTSIETVIGGSGNDTYVIGNADVGNDAFFQGGAGFDTIDASTSFSAISFMQLFQGSVEKVIGTAGNDVIVRVASEAIEIQGMGGHDDLRGGSGNDTLNGGDGLDHLVGGAGDDVLQGGADDDGFSMFDPFGAGNDQVDGGAGTDFAYYDTLTDEIFTLVGAGTSEVKVHTTNVGVDTLTNVENLRYQEFNTVSNMLLSDNGAGFSLFTGNGLQITPDHLFTIFNDGNADGVDDLIPPINIQYSITSLPTNGQILLNGSIPVAGFSQQDVNDGKISYQHDGSNTTTDTVELSTTADGQTLNGVMMNFAITPPPQVMNVTQGTGHNTIQDAFDNAAANDVISVDPSYSAGPETVSAAISGLQLILPAGLADAQKPDVNLVGAANSFTILGASGETSGVVTGSSAGESLRGGDANDDLRGGAGDDAIYTSAGDDAMDGGAGADRIWLAGSSLPHTVDFVTGTMTGNGNDTIANFEHVTGSTNGDIIRGDAGDNQFVGYHGNDVLEGRDGNDDLQGQNGDDTLIGGAGDDSLDGGSNSDTADYSTATGPITVTMSNSVNGTATGDGNDTLISIEKVIGTAGDDVYKITGHTPSSDAGFDGGAGFDTFDASGNFAGLLFLQVNSANLEQIIGTAVHDNIVWTNATSGILYGGGGGDFLDGGAQNDSLFGEDDNDVLSGSLGNDALDGGTGDDTLSGGVGDDVLIGGAGNDTASYDNNQLDGLIVLQGTGADLAKTVTTTLHGTDSLTGAEQIRYFDNSLLDFTLSTADPDYDVLEGGNVSIDPEELLTLFNDGAGNGDQLSSPADIFYKVTSAPTNGFVVLDGFLDGTNFTQDYINSGRMTYMHDGSDTVSDQFTFEVTAGGVTQSGLIYSLNVIPQGEVTNTTQGTNHNTIQEAFDNAVANDVISVDPGYTVGPETVSFSTDGLTLILPAGLATNLKPTMNATSGVTFTIDGGALAESGVVNGSADADHLIGLGSHDDLRGAGGKDVLDGGAGDDDLSGGDGDDILLPGSGQNLVDGGAGTDTVSFVGAAASVAVDLAAGLATGTGTTALTSVENVVGSGFDDTLAGDAGDNVLDGGAGNDTADYSAATGPIVATVTNGNGTVTGDGTDTLTSIETVIGTAGDDTYNIGNADQGNDSFFQGGAGFDTIDASSSFTAISNMQLFQGDVEKIIGTAAGDTIDRVASEAVEMHGGGGNDVLSGSAGDDDISGNADDDQLHGAGGNDVLGGNEGNDVLFGGAGDDVLDGGTGSDEVDYADSANNALIALQGVGAGQVTAHTTHQGTDSLIDVESLQLYAQGSQTAFLATATPEYDVLEGGAVSIDPEELLTLFNDGGAADNITTANIIYTVTSAPANGWVTLDGFQVTNSFTQEDINTGRISYTHDGSNTIADQFTFDVTAGGETLTGLTYDLNVIPQPDVSNNTQGTTHNTLQEAFDAAVDGDELEILANYSPVAAETVTFAANNITLLVPAGLAAALKPTLDATVGVTFTILGAPGETSGTVNGSSDDDVLNGGDADDVLNGNTGDDVLAGGAGDDALDGGAGVDEADFSQSATAVSVDLVAGTATGEGTDTLAGIENVTGSAFNDVIVGDGNDNVVEAGAGDDTAEGGAGTDTYAFRDATEGVRFDLGNVRNPQLISNELGTDLVSGFERADGSDFNDVLLAANAGGELIGRKGGDSLIGRAGDDVLNGGAGKDVLLGKGGNDTIIGGSGDDFIRGGEGDDNIDGGSGTDTADYGSRSEAIDVDLAAGTVAVGTTGEVDMLANVENVIATAHDDVLAGDGNDNSLNGKDGNDTIDGRAGNDTLIGEAGDDNIEGGDGNDAIYGGAGADTLSDGAGDDTVAGQEGDDLLISGLGTDRIDGGDGVDTVTYDAFTDGVFVNLGSRSGFFLNGVPGLQDRLLNIENAIGTGVADTLVGSSGNNVLTAGLGDDFARGQAGDDVIDAGDGNDTLLGDDGNDTLIGGEGDDFFRGGAGDDDMDGGNGTNLADYSDIGDGVTVDLRIVGPQAVSALGGNDSLTNINNLQASNFDSTLIGNDNANTLLGRDANDTLDGQGGNDLLLGRDGDDILRPGTTDGVGVDTVRGDNGFDIVDFEGQTNALTIDLSAGTALRTDGDPSVNAVLTSIEGARGGDAHDVLIGDGGDNLLGGRGSDNYLDGGDGNDTFELGLGFDDGTGGAGFDVGDYSQITGEQFNIRFAASGNLVTNHMSTGVLHDLIADMEGARGGQLGDLITMVNEAGHLAAGQAGDDTLISKGNSDILLGEAGNDLIRNDTGGSDVLAGGDGDDVIEDLVSFPAATVNLMSGGGGADVLTGGEGDDVLFGGAGDDVLTAGNIARGSNAGPTVSGATFNGLENDLDGMINNVLANMGLDPARTVIDLSVLNEARTEANGLDASFAGTNALVGGSLFIGFDANDGEQTDILSGGDGNDQLNGANENHVIMFGGAGDDLLDGERARGLVMMGGDGNDTLLANVNNSRTISVMDGGDGADTITGSNVADTLIVGSNGTATADTADGGDGNDRLIAAHGNGLSELLGGNGNDVFEVHAVNQTVSVLDFTSGSDLFELNTGGTVTDFAGLQAFITAPDMFVIGGLTTTLVGVDIAADLSDADFIFV